MHKFLLRFSGLAFAAALLAAPFTASAVPVQYFLQNSGVQPGNDCAGALGKPPKCYYNDSPLIAKFDVDGAGNLSFTSGLFPSVDGSEFLFSGVAGSSGTFTYTPNGAGDPAIRYWSVKAGPQYIVYWLTLLANGGVNDAVSVPTGVSQAWATAPLPNGNLPDLSHISFYDTGGDQGQVPEPGSLALLGLGLLGLGLARRRAA